MLGLPAGAVYAVVGALAAVENVFPPVPADTAVAVGAFLTTGGRISLGAIFGITWAANVSSAVAVYLAGRTVGRSFFQGRLGQRLLRPDALVRLEHLYARYGVWGILISRCIPGLRAVVPPFAGVAGLSAWKAIPPLAVASAVWYGTLSVLAATLVREVDEIVRLIRQVNVIGGVVGGVLVAAGIVGAWQWRRRRREKHEDAES